MVNSACNLAADGREITAMKLVSFVSIISLLPTNFKALSFNERREIINNLTGSQPVMDQVTSFPSGGGSQYSWWIVEQDGKPFFMRIERGGYDCVTGQTFCRDPQITRPLRREEVAAGKMLWA